MIQSFYWAFKWYGWYLLNIKEYNLNKRRIILILFADMIADMLSNKKI